MMDNAQRDLDTESDSEVVLDARPLGRWALLSNPKQGQGSSLYYMHQIRRQCCRAKGRDELRAHPQLLQPSV